MIKVSKTASETFEKAKKKIQSGVTKSLDTSLQPTSLATPWKGFDSESACWSLQKVEVQN